MDGSPPSSHHNNRDPILHRQDWELLSASTLLTQSHILGLGLGLGLGREDGDGSSGPTSRDSGNSVDETNPSFLSFSGVYGRSSLPVDMSQISAMYNSSTSASASVLEPFTEGWEPQFRIAGAPLQEDYYGREDPFVVLDSNLGLQRHRHQNEPFLVMEQTFLAEPDSIVIAEKEEKASSLRDSNSLRKQREAEEFGAEKGLNDDDDEEDEEEDDEEEDDDDDVDESMKKCSFQVTKFTKSKVSSVFGEKISQWNQNKHLYQRSHIILSVAIATALLGVFLYRKSNAS